MEEERLIPQNPNPLTTMDIDTKEKEIISQNKRSPLLLGFLYNKTYKQVNFSPLPPTVCENPQPQLKIQNPNKKFNDSACAVLSSSNGLVLYYMSSYLKKSVTNKSSSFYHVQDPLTAQVVGSIPTNTSTSLALSKRFCVYGFVVDPHSPRLSFTIVAMSDTSHPRPGSLLVNKFRSVDTSRCWRPYVVHNGDDLVPSLGENYVFSGSSTYLHGSLHWLLDSSGVIAYYLDSDCFKFHLLNIPGDKQHVNEFGLCNCITRITDCNKNATSTRSVCNCRYLGECRDKLVYARVTGDSEFSVWILEDYYAAVWSNCHRVRVNNLEASLFSGRVLAFSRTNAHLVFLRVENSIFSYDCMTGKLELMGTLNKTYKGDDKWDGFVVPFELPIVPLAFRKEDTVQIVSTEPGTSRTISGQQNCWYQHYAVTDLAVKVLPIHPQQHDFNKMVGGLPFRSSVFLQGQDSTVCGYSVKERYSELIRLEAALYGSIARLLSTDRRSSGESSPQLSQTPASSSVDDQMVRDGELKVDQ